MRVTLQRRVTWRPPALGNLDLPDDEQVEIDILVPTASEYSAIVSRASGPFPSRQVWLDHVTAIRGLQAEVDGETVDVTPESMVDLPGMGALVETTVVRILGLAAAPDPT